MSADHGLAGEAWVKSSYSTSEGGECVEWAPAYVRARGVVPVRDSKSQAGPAVLIPHGQWTGFVTAVKRGEI